MTIPKIPGSGINLDLKLGYLKKKKPTATKLKTMSGKQLCYGMLAVLMTSSALQYPLLLSPTQKECNVQLYPEQGSEPLGACHRALDLKANLPFARNNRFINSFKINLALCVFSCGPSS